MIRNARQGRRAWYGAAIIAGVTGFAVLIFFLDDIIAALQRRYAVVVVVEDAPGIIAGSPVWLSGKEVGRVLSVAFMPSGPDTLVNLALTLELPLALQRQVRGDSHVRLTAASLIGAPVVDVLPGTTAAPMLGPGDTLRTPPRSRRELLTAQAAAVRASLDSTLLQLQQLGPVMRVRVDAVSSAFGSLQAALTRAATLQRDFRNNPGVALLRDTAFSRSLERSRTHAAELQSLLRTLPQRGAAGGELSAALTRLRTRADSLSTLLDHTALQMQDGFLLRAQRDSALFRAITQARTELDSLIAETKRNPLRFFF